MKKRYIKIFERFFDKKLINKIKFDKTKVKTYSDRKFEFYSNEDLTFCTKYINERNRFEWDVEGDYYNIFRCLGQKERLKIINKIQEKISDSLGKQDWSTFSLYFYLKGDDGVEPVVFIKQDKKIIEI